jgi:hypothetical protein
MFLEDSPEWCALGGVVFRKERWASPNASVLVECPYGGCQDVCHDRVLIRIKQLEVGRGRRRWVNPLSFGNLFPTLFSTIHHAVASVIIHDLKA